MESSEQLPTLDHLFLDSFSNYIPYSLMENFHTHDRGYKYLFSNPLLVKELLESFVNMDWVGRIDFSKAESLNTSFVSDEFKHRESDIIYKLKLNDNEIYLYLLIEFQSTVDRFMALRMLRYTLELYDYLIKNKVTKELPVVFPLMLYNGEAKWTAPESLSKLINLPEELKSLKKYVPEFRYFSIIENRYSDRQLKKLGNLTSAIFLLENQDKERLFKVIEAVKSHLEGSEISAVRTFLAWLKKYLQVNATIEDAEKGIKKIKSSVEAKSMLAKTIEEVRKDLVNEGIQLGIKKGIKQGMQQGIQQGMQKGIQKGMLTGKRETALAMKKKGIDIKVISEVTGLPIGEIRKLKN